MHKKTVDVSINLALKPVISAQITILTLKNNLANARNKGGGCSIRVVGKIIRSEGVAG